MPFSSFGTVVDFWSGQKPMSFLAPKTCLTGLDGETFMAASSMAQNMERDWTGRGHGSNGAHQSLKQPACLLERLSAKPPTITVCV